MSEQQSTSAPAGWYPDGSGHQRWWDGSAWQQYAPAPQQVMVVQPPRPPSNGYAIASMVIGLVGFVLAITIIGLFIAIPAAPIGIGLGIAGLVRAKKINRGWGQALTGLILCSSPFAIWIFSAIANAVTGN